MQKYIFGVVCCLLGLIGPCGAQSDSLLLTYEDFLTQVYNQHPVAMQVQLLRNKANTYLQKSRGGFDPKLGANWDYKQFKQKNYFNILQAQLKVPIWSGVSVEAGYNYTAGQYLNPENNLPAEGQAFLGLKVSLLKGLWTDERRAAIQKSKVLQEASEAEIRQALNDLLYEAATAYWEWTKAYNNRAVAERALGIARQQLRVVRISFQQGDKPAIDTLKAFIRLQEREVLLADMSLAFRNKGRKVSTYLWQNAQTPVELPADVHPTTLQALVNQPFSEDILEASLAQIEQHPALQLYQFKFEQLEIERRLNINKLLPKLDVKYNFLSGRHVDFFYTGAAAPIENYKLGVKFSMPLFLRKERAALQLTKLKLQEVGFLRRYKEQSLRIKVQNYFDKVQIAASQVGQIEQMISNYQQILEAEQIKLNIGESSVFLVNTRENQLLQAQLKLIKKQITYLKAKAAFFWVNANLNNNID